MESFFENLENKIRSGVKKETEKILTEVGDERIYSVALVTDGDYTSLYLALNTYEYMEKRDARYIKDESYLDDLRDSLSEEKIESIKDGTVSLTKWIPDEWGYSDGKGSELNEVSRLLFEKETPVDPDEYSEYTKEVLAAVIVEFKNVIDSNIFGDRTEKITFFVSMSDGENRTEIENYSARILNPESLYKEFLKRNEFWGMYIEGRYWDGYIGGTDDCLTLVDYLAEKQKEELSLGEIFSDLGLDKLHWDFRKTDVELGFTDSEGMDCEMHYAIDIVTALAALLLECRASGSVNLDELYEEHTDTSVTSVHITATPDEHRLMEKVLADFVSDPLAYDLSEMCPEEEMMEMAELCEELAEELYG